MENMVTNVEDSRNPIGKLKAVRFGGVLKVR